MPGVGQAGSGPEQVQLVQAGPRQRCQLPFDGVPQLKRNLAADDDRVRLIGVRHGPLG
jgi:hypothetical protein